MYREFVDYAALKYFAELLKTRNTPGRLRIFTTGSGEGDDTVYVHLEHDKRPENRTVPDSSEWESVNTLFSALMGPNASLRTARLFVSGDTKHVEVVGYLPGDEMDRINAQQIAMFRGEQLNASVEAMAEQSKVV